MTRDLQAGEKFADSDLIGLPMRIVISDKSLTAGGVEVKERAGTTADIMSLEQCLLMFTKVC
jgi:prolyl-tRNA synthetase